MPKASLPLPEQLGTASFIGTFANGSPEWHAVRAKGIGGSEVSTICGLNKWESAFTLWAKKTGQISDNLKQSEPMFWGSKLESVIMDEFITRNPDLEVWEDAGTWRSSKPNEEWCHANPDGIFKDADGDFGIIEIKTAAYADDWNLPAENVRGSAEDVPVYYRTQVQWYLRIFGFKKAIVVALFSGNKYREFEVPAHEMQQTVDLVMATEFRECVNGQQPPAWDGSQSTYETVRVMHPEIDDTDIELGALGVEYINMVKDFQHVESQLTELKSMVLDYMGHAKRGLVGGQAIVKRQAGRNGAAPYLMNMKGL